MNTWLPRVTDAPDEVEADDCAVDDDPAAAGMTLETSAVADAIIVEAVLAVDAV